MGETESGIVCGLPSEDSGSSWRQRVAKERTRLASVHNDDIRGVPFGLIEHLAILSESKQRIRIPTTPQRVFLSPAPAVDCAYRAESPKNGQGRGPITACGHRHEIRPTTSAERYVPSAVAGLGMADDRIDG